MKYKSESLFTDVNFAMILNIRQHRRNGLVGTINLSSAFIMRYRD
jgi:hypothetical protein